MKPLILPLLIVLIACVPALAQTPVYDIRVPDSMAMKNTTYLHINAVVDSAHRYDLGEYVKKAKYDSLEASYKTLLSLDSRHIAESLQLLDPALIRFAQIMSDTSLIIIPKKDLPQKPKSKKSR